jgi:hypothetical protein
MKKVLIVSPHFPPINAPDMQRVRLALPFLRAHGWEPTVLAVAPESVEGGVRDPLLEQTYPADVRVIRVKGIPPQLTRWAGVGSLTWRCGGALRRVGDALLAREKFDLVFFSTTQWGVLAFGPRWRARFGVPYVLDYQDPWLNPYYAKTGARPPGGRLKFAVSQWAARRVEPHALRDASGVIAVSSSYGDLLATSYPWFDPKRVELLPFGASAEDFKVAVHHRPARPLIDFDDGYLHFVYTGRCGPDMTLSLTILFDAFKRYAASHPTEAARVRFNFIGTDYSPPPLGRDWALPIARKEGVEAYVLEHRHRVPYFDALYYLGRAHALLAVGSNDPTYAASKIFPYILARRPMLLLYHEKSLVLEFAARARVGTRFAFSETSNIYRLAEEVHQRWFVSRESDHYDGFDETAFGPFTAEVLTARLAAVFDRAVSAS